MYLQAERTALTSLLVLAFCHDFRVSSFALPQSIPPSSEYVFPTEEKAPTAAALVGGHYAKIGQFPWMAAIHRFNGYEKSTLCAGTIISVRWILTAGHCVPDYNHIYNVILGDINRIETNKNPEHGPGLRMISNIAVLYPEYDREYKDIALLWMPQDITFNDVIQPIRLAEANVAREMFAAKTGLVMGWGRERPDDRNESLTLKYLEFPIMENEECGKTWIVFDSNVCIDTAHNADLCMGDGGDPLVVRVNNEYLQLGLASYGYDTCSGINPGVFTRVSSFMEWIQLVTGIRN